MGAGMPPELNALFADSRAPGAPLARTPKPAVAGERERESRQRISAAARQERHERTDREIRLLGCRGSERHRARRGQGGGGSQGGPMHGVLR